MGSDGRLFHRVATFLVCASIALGAPCAFAQSDADRATARQLGQEGQEALKAGDWGKAAERFARADALFHAPTLMIGLARAQRGMGKLVAANETYRRLLRDPLPADAPPAYRNAVEEGTAELAELAPRIPFITITIEGGVQPRATLDDQALLPATWGIKRPIDPGKHVIRAGDYGFVPVQKIVEVAEGTAQTITLKLEPAGPGQAQWSGYPPVAGQPGATGPSVPAAPPPKKPGSGMKIAGLVILGVGAVGLVAGAITGIVAIDYKGTLDDVCNANGECPVGEADNVSSYESMGTASTVSFVIGGVAAATGAILLIAAPSPPKEEKKPAPLALSAGPGGISFRGSF